MIDLNRLHNIENWGKVIEDFRSRLYKVKTILDWNSIERDVHHIEFSWDDLLNIRGLLDEKTFLIIETKMDLLFMEIECMRSIYEVFLGE